MKYVIFTPLLFAALLLFYPLSQAAVETEEVSYYSGDTQMKGFIAYDDAIKGKRPGVLVVHEWWGHNEYARRRATMLAEAGYTALAVDMYGDGKKADHPKDAGAFAGAVRKNMAVAEARFKAALELLKGHSTVAAESMSAIGYCFGGGIVLEMARRGVDLDLIASFHGSLTTSAHAAAGSLNGMKVLVFNGADDPMVKAEHLTALLSEMTQAKAELTLVNYPNTLHSFTNPDADHFGANFNIPLRYSPTADKDSWSGLLDALQQRYGM